MILLLLGVPFIGFLVTIFSRDAALGIFVALLAWVFIGGYACEKIDKGDEKYAVRDTTEIQSAVTGSGTDGKFVLGSGTIEDTRFYAYWTTEGTHQEGAVERRRISDKDWDVEIVETDSTSQIVFVEYKKEESWNKIYLDSKYQRATIYVPKGAVKYNYNLKAK